MVSDIAYVEHRRAADLTLETEVPRLHIAHPQLGIEVVHAVARTDWDRVRGSGRLGARRQSLIAQPNRAGRAEIRLEVFGVDAEVLRPALIPAPDADEEVHAFADGRDGIAAAQHRAAVPADQPRKQRFVG